MRPAEYRMREYICLLRLKLDQVIGKNFEALVKQMLSGFDNIMLD